MTLKQLIPFALLLLILTATLQYSSIQKTHTYTAYYEEPCGRSLLVLAGPGQESVAVQARGKSPIHELKHIILATTKLNVRGYFTGRHIDDHHCGSYPEFYVTDYSAAGPVTRCTSVVDWLMYEQAVLYPPGLPKNKFINLDYNKHSALLNEVPINQCRAVEKDTVCKTDETPAYVCGQDMYWCCKK